MINENLLWPFAKRVLVLLGLVTTASSAEAGIDTKDLGSGNKKLIIPDIEMEEPINISWKV